MPMYEYYCDKCVREVMGTLSISEHEKGRIQCPRVRRQIPAGRRFDSCQAPHQRQLLSDEHASLP